MSRMNKSLWIMVLTATLVTGCEAVRAETPSALAEPPTTYRHVPCEITATLTTDTFALGGDTCTPGGVHDTGATPSGWLEYGDWYEITLPPGGEFQATVSTEFDDGAVLVVDRCAPPLEILTAHLSQPAGSGIELFYVNLHGEDRTVYLVVGAGPGRCGRYKGEFLGGAIAPRETPTWGVAKSWYR